MTGKGAEIKYLVDLNDPVAHLVLVLEFPYVSPPVSPSHQIFNLYSQQSHGGVKMI